MLHHAHYLHGCCPRYQNTSSFLGNATIGSILIGAGTKAYTPLADANTVVDRNLVDSVLMMVPNGGFPPGPDAVGREAGAAATTTTPPLGPGPGLDPSLGAPRPDGPQRRPTCDPWAAARAGNSTSACRLGQLAPGHVDLRGGPHRATIAAAADWCKRKSTRCAGFTVEVSCPAVDPGAEYAIHFQDAHGVGEGPNANASWSTWILSTAVESCPAPGTYVGNLALQNESFDIRQELRDPYHMDFRPCPLSRAAAMHVGAYRPQVGNDTTYWIPGRQLRTQVTTPIPPDAAVDVKLDADLMFLPMRGAVAHRVYLGRDPTSLKLVGTLFGDANVVNIAAGMAPDTPHAWRVDAVSAQDTLVTGAVWTLRTGQKRSCTP
eukprot:SAG22_NODE_483_length_9925_cov_3.568186_4_plen_377_part_00